MTESPKDESLILDKENVEENPPQQKSLELLLAKSKKTTEARYVASRRLNAMSNISTLALGLFSLAIVSSSLVALVFPEEFTGKAGKILASEAIVLSLLTMLFQFYEHGKAYQKKAYIFHQSGRELSQLNNRLEHALLSSPNNDHEMWDDYHRIINEHDINHSDIDYKYSRSMEHGSFVEKFYWWSAYQFITYGSLLIYLGLFVVFLFIGYTAYPIEISPSIVN